jgi:hypothetical protein
VHKHVNSYQAEKEFPLMCGHIRSIPPTE